MDAGVLKRATCFIRRSCLGSSDPKASVVSANTGPRGGYWVKHAQQFRPLLFRLSSNESVAGFSFGSFDLEGRLCFLGWFI